MIHRLLNVQLPPCTSIVGPVFTILYVQEDSLWEVFGNLGSHSLHSIITVQGLNKFQVGFDNKEQH